MSLVRFVFYFAPEIVLEIGLEISDLTRIYLQFLLVDVDVVCQCLKIFDVQSVVILIVTLTTRGRHLFKLAASCQWRLPQYANNYYQCSKLVTLFLQHVNALQFVFNQVVIFFFSGMKTIYWRFILDISQWQSCTRRKMRSGEISAIINRA